ncbi:DGQHR domain-containing protein [Candidatus Bathyarchaeota archaeon]|nr:DGQHR domain-containing protein [Candidatus Bathyarchaeota archaeon]
MQLDAFCVTQRGGLEGVEIFITVFKAKDVVDRYGIDRWNIDNPEGYQRLPSESRLMDRRGSPVRYLVREWGCFPTSILLNVRGDVGYTKEKDMGWFSYGMLDTGDERLWLIDGQHRIEALKRAIERNRDFEDYPVIASIMRLPERFDEMMLFYIVNKRQRSVPTDLVYRHLQRMLWKRGKQWVMDFEGSKGVRIGLATEVVDILNQSPRSPWHQRVQIVGEKRHEDHIVPDSLLIRSVADLLRENILKGMPVSEIGRLLIDYWNAVYQLYPECFTEPSAYTLLGTPGVQVMHMLFPLVYSKCIQGGSVDETSMESQLEKLMEETPSHTSPELKRPIDSEFWSRTHGPLIALSTGRQSVEALFNGLAEKMRLAEMG